MGSTAGKLSPNGNSFASSISIAVTRVRSAAKFLQLDYWRRGSDPARDADLVRDR
jgi:hypothetical protein